VAEGQLPYVPTSLTTSLAGALQTKKKKKNSMVRKIGRTNEQRLEKKVKILYIVFTKNKIEKREEAENTLKQKF